jgi:hypothetical protein
MNFFDSVEIRTNVFDNEIYLTVKIRNKTVLSAVKIGQIVQTEFFDENGRELFEFEAWLGDNTIGQYFSVMKHSHKEIKREVENNVKHEVLNYLENMFQIYRDDKKNGLWILNE